MKHYVLNKFIHVFEAHPSEGSLVAHHEDKLSKVEDIKHDWFEDREESGWKEAAGINCSFYNTNGTRNGMSLEDGSNYQGIPTVNDPWVEMIWKDNKLIIDELTPLDYATKYKGATFIKGVCPLIRDGKPDTSKPQVAKGVQPRTAFGQKADGTIVKLATDGRPKGLTEGDTTLLMLGLGCINAVMCDGGKSSTMTINGKMVNKNVNALVYDALKFYSKGEVIECEDVVCLDAGHAYNTPGKRTPQMPNGEYIHESEQNYPVMFEAAKHLENHNISVVYTNTDPINDLDANVNTALRKRIYLQKLYGPTLTQSIHANAGPEYKWSSITGTETWCASKGFTGDKLATAVQKRVIEYSKNVNRGVKYCDANNDGDYSDAVDKYLGFIIDTSGPTALVELSFMTNLDDAKLMRDTTAHKLYGKAIAHGVCDCLGIAFKGLESTNNEVTEPIIETDTLAQLVKLAKEQIIAINNTIEKIEKLT